MANAPQINLDDRLREDKNGDYKREFLDKLNAMKGELQAEVNKGLKPGEFEVVDQVMKSIEQAEVAVEKFWTLVHASK